MPAISTLALDVVAKDLGLTVPYPLAVRSRGATAADRAVNRERATEELNEAELLDHTGRPGPQLERWLRTLARPDVSIDSAYLPELGAEPVRAVAALAGRSAVLATQRDEDSVRLRPVSRDQLVSVIVELLPERRRGSEISISIPDGRQAHTEDRQALARLTAMPRRRGGQLAANGGGLRGRRRSPLLTWFDTDAGRYFAQHLDAWLTIAPADPATLRKRLQEMVFQVTAENRNHLRT
jgi:hypothetical protein